MPISNSRCLSRRIPPGRALRRLTILAGLIVGVVAWACPAAAVGTWSSVTRLNMPPGGNPANVALLTDGRVLVSGTDSTQRWNQWWTLTPDFNGSYATGTWTQVGNSAFGRVFSPAFILRDGRYWICGGEFLCPANNLLCGIQDGAWSSCEVFDPTFGNNSWSLAPNMPESLHDSPAALLADGRVLALGDTSTNTFVFNPDPPLPAWASAPQYNAKAIGGEGGSLLLPDGSALVGAFKFERFMPTNQWLPARSTSTISGGTDVGEFLLAPTNAEIGPFML